jgi:hypothetical protein
MNDIVTVAAFIGLSQGGGGVGVKGIFHIVR